MLDKILEFIIGDLLGASKPPPVDEEKRKEVARINREIAESRREKPTPTPTPALRGDLSGFVGQSPRQDVLDLILRSSKESKVDPNLLAALLYQESRFNPSAVGASNADDVGIAQINLGQHPVTRQQALDPSFAIPWAARYLAESQGKFNDINRSLASYNVGRGGANVRGPEPFGGGPLGQTYINNVARNLTPEMIKQLGIITSGR